MNMIAVTIAASAVALLVNVAHAEYVVCGDGNKLTHAYFSDPSKVSDPNCHVIPSQGDETASQVALVEGNPRRYLKVVSGRAEVMSQAEKDAVDAAIATQAANLQAFRDEIQQQDFCAQATLADLTAIITTRKATLSAQIATAKANLQSQIDAIANNTAATIRAGFTQMNNVIFNVAGNEIDEIYLVADKLGRCLLASRKAR